MGWLRFLSFVFNFLGALFLLAAAGVFFISMAASGSIGSEAGNGATFGAAMGGMIGTAAAVTNFLAALWMFFCGAVLSALNRLIEEAVLRRQHITA
ncbi:MAG TPA: hypothetical protein VM733_11900 [Thermoanaerobaculia bacterium]|nr:hypothetical protein [Thermoanaerobaculia bacterium]